MSSSGSPTKTPDYGAAGELPVKSLANKDTLSALEEGTKPKSSEEKGATGPTVKSTMIDIEGTKPKSSEGATGPTVKSTIVGGEGISTGENPNVQDHTEAKFYLPPTPHSHYTPRASSVRVPYTPSSYHVPEEYMPTKPKMGGILHKGSYHYAWTGGKHDIHWRGLDPSTKKREPTTFMLRDNGPKSQTSTKDRESNIYGVDSTKKFKKDKADVDHFVKELLKFLTKMGMDVIIYRKDPLDSTKMVNILTDYYHLNKKVMAAQAPWFLERYDSYDEENDRQAKECLLATLEDPLKKKIENKLDLETTFAEAFFIFLDEIRPRSASSGKIETDEILAVKPQDFPHQNVSDYVATVKPKIDILIRGNLWDSINNIEVLRTLITA